MKTQIKITKQKIQNQIQFGDYFCQSPFKEDFHLYQRIILPGSSEFHYINIKCGLSGIVPQDQIPDLIKLKIVAFENDTLIFEPVD